MSTEGAGHVVDQAMEVVHQGVAGKAQICFLARALAQQMTGRHPLVRCEVTEQVRLGIHIATYRSISHSIHPTLSGTTSGRLKPFLVAVVMG